MFDYIRELIGVMMLALVPAFGALAWAAVRRERRRQRAALVEPILEAPDTANSPYAATENAFYVATTFVSEPLRRVWAFGLGSRGRSSVKILDGGLAIYRRGESSLFIPYSSMIAVSTAGATIDKGTEANGLITLIWKHGEVELQTALRFPSITEHNQIFKQLKEQVDAFTH